MPLAVQEHAITDNSCAYFARVLSDQPAVTRQLAAAIAEDAAATLVIEAVFNAQPVGLLLAHAGAAGCRVEAIVVHPATRGRRVGRELLQKGAPLLPAPVEWAEPLRTLVARFIEND